ncbi:MAG: hypothetical protein L0H12_05290 [Nitrosospira sp.]|nr:hypothetical protein [Nitrosospira sp.]MDN5881593.1 hypothetical protein [Nitrosospira sp.]
MNTAATAQEQDQARKKDKNDTLAPTILLAPPIIAADAKLAGGCWAKLYTAENYQGDVLSLVGPVDVPDARVGALDWGRKYDSVIMGPIATLMVYNNQLYLNRSAAFTPGQRVPDLDKELGFFENIESLKVSCTE